MIGSSVVVRTRSWIVLVWSVFGLSAASRRPIAAECPGHPDALGTSRTLVVDPHEHPRIGTMQYRETLPLKDHEVVLTFDDGPLPKYSNQVLQILADECIKATFFIIGEQAKANPEGVRKLVAAGHTVGTHSMNHPLTFDRMPLDKAEAQINGGIEWTSAAMTDPSKLAPFFRIPGLMRADGVENFLISRGIQVWSADFPADDWRHVSSDRVYQLAIQRLEAKGKGILLLHDIQARTVAALPKIIRDLKARGYRIVHVVPATADRPATPTDPQQWQLHPYSETVAISHWPKIPNFVYAKSTTLPAPDLADLAWQDTAPKDRAQRRAWRDAQWSRQVTLVLDPPALPVPAANVFKLPESVRVTMLYSPPSARRVERTAEAREVEAPVKPVSVRAGQAGPYGPCRRRPASGRREHAAHQTARAGKSGKAAAKHAAQAKPAGKPAKKPAVRVEPPLGANQIQHCFWGRQSWV